MKHSSPFFRKTLAILGCASLLLSASAMVQADTLDRIKERGKMVVAIDPTFAPYEYTTPDGTVTGYSPQIMAAVADKLGVKLEYQKMAFSGIIPGLIAGSFDAEASTLNVTAERAEKVLFTVPYGKTVNGVLVRANDDFVGDTLTESDLAGKTAAVKSASMPEKILKDISATLVASGQKPIKLLTVDTVDQTIGALMARRADFVFDDISVLASILEKHSNKIAMKGELGPAQWMAWATRKDDTRLNQAISEVILSLQESGELQEWQKQYLGVTFSVPASDFIPQN